MSIKRWWEDASQNKELQIGGSNLFIITTETHSRCKKFNCSQHTLNIYFLWYRKVIWWCPMKFRDYWFNFTKNFSIIIAKMPTGGAGFKTKNQNSYIKQQGYFDDSVHTICVENTLVIQTHYFFINKQSK